MSKFVYNTTTVATAAQEASKCMKMAKNTAGFFNISLTTSNLKERINDLKSVLTCMEGNYKIVYDILSKVNDDIIQFEENGTYEDNGIADGSYQKFKEVSDYFKYDYSGFKLSTDSLLEVEDTSSSNTELGTQSADTGDAGNATDSGDTIYDKPDVTSTEGDDTETNDGTDVVIDGTIDDTPGTTISIPTSISQSGISTDYTQNYGTRSWAYDQKKMRNAWANAGGKTDGNMATINGRYLIACTSTFGNVGDNVDITLEDGTVIPAVIADVKAQEVCAWDSNPADKWGHKKSDGTSIVEWEITGTSWNSIYNNLNEKGWYDQDVVSITNKGSGNYF